jgi:hypothetical protein
MFADMRTSEQSTCTEFGFVNLKRETLRLLLVRKSSATKPFPIFGTQLGYQEWLLLATGCPRNAFRAVPYVRYHWRPKNAAAADGPISSTVRLKEL